MGVDHTLGSWPGERHVGPAAAATTQDVDSIEEDDSTVVRCLQDYVDEITNPMCKQQVRCAPPTRLPHILFALLKRSPCPRCQGVAGLAFAAFAPRTAVAREGRIASRAERAVRVLREQVRKYQELAAEDIRFDVPLAEACYADRQSYCANVPPVSRANTCFAQPPPRPQACGAGPRMHGRVLAREGERLRIFTSSVARAMERCADRGGC